ncbi:MAG: hypothetical protein QOI45_996 [Thermoleophilaceae bacterium]|nr:hypothetical protein [Thermoleophilaceae bacterium]MEA2454734.1 hypothetical protein [Thermoleophilaceae bacterium]
MARSSHHRTPNSKRYAADAPTLSRKASTT